MVVLTNTGLDVDFRHLTIEQRIQESYKAFRDTLVLTTSGGETSSLLPHLVRRALPNAAQKIPIIFVDTGYLPDSTLDNVQHLEDQGYNIQTYRPKISRAVVEAQHGTWWEDPEVRAKVVQTIKYEPLNRAFGDFGAQSWMNGIRRYQNEYRASADFVEYKNGLVKIHPLLDMSRSEVDHVMDTMDLHRNTQHYDLTKESHQSSECGIHLRCGVE